MKNSMRPKPAQLSVMAVAALAIVAVAAVMLLAGGDPAQATNAETVALNDSGDGIHLRPVQQAKETPTPTPRFPQPERCSAVPAEVVSSGHIALFDVYWNPGEKELTNTSCPPTVVYVPADEEEETPARYERTGSSINIEETVIHVPNDAEVDLTKSGTPYTQAKYPALWAADNKENRDTDGDGDGDGIGDRKVWALVPGNDWLNIGFSAYLLNPADWGNSDEEGAVSGDRKVQYEFDHVHQLDIGEQGRRYALTYNVPAEGAAGPFTPIWDTSNSDRNETQVLPGEYEHPIWFFTRAGRYEFQVHVKGHPDQARTGGVPPVSVDTAVTSDVRNYTFHVGLMADLSLTKTCSDVTPNVGDQITCTLTASNAGPDTATSTKVDVTLPDGLTYLSHSPTTDAFDDSDGDGTRTWSVGDLAKDASKTLVITARVGAQTGGKQMEVTAEIYATEHIASSGRGGVGPEYGPTTPPSAS